jgi:prevent-host-death family protein
MREVGVLEAKTHLSALLDAVEREGEEIVITRHGRPVARLINSAQEKPRSVRLSGEELVQRATEFKNRLSQAHPKLDALTWEELKDMARS